MISAEIIMIVRMTFFTVSMTIVLQFILNLEYNNAEAAKIQECQMCRFKHRWISMEGVLS